MSVTNFDLIVVGAGSGNSIPGPEFDDLNIALIDDAPHFGGTCLNVGCIPTKMYVHVADVLSELRDAVEKLGVTSNGVAANWDEVRNRTFSRIDPISESAERYRRDDCPNITLYREKATFVDKHSVELASGEVLSAPRIVIAAGSRARLLPELPLGPRVHTSDTIMRLESFPERIVVVGGGAIACEFAHVFSSYGAEVTQLQRSTLLKGVDSDLAEAFTAEAQKRWDVRLGTTVLEADVDDARCLLTLSDHTTLECDVVLVATGRVANGDVLGLKDVGFDVLRDGRVAVDEYLRVLANGEPVEGVFALGDVCSPWQLKHVANEQQRVVHHNLAVASVEEYRRDSLGPIPAVVFSDPQVSWFGLTLAEALEQGIDAVEARHDYGSSAWGWALEDTTSFVKLVVDRASEVIIGGHLIGPDSAMLMQPLSMAASFKLPLRGLARGQYWPHPAANEIIENVLLKAEARLDEPDSAESA